MPNPPSKKYLNSLIEACSTLEATDDVARASKALATPTLPAKAHRPSPSPALAANVLERDGFACRYCGAKVVPGAILRAAALTWPDALPHDAGWHREATHPIFLANAAAFDLVAPLAISGDEDDASFVTACWGCSAQKGELSLKRLGWELRRPKHSDWDGLVSSYESLLWHRRHEALTSGERSYHVRWLRAFELDADVLRRWAGSIVRAA
jgi:5-methylcytosine-specific restriction endonuclease McrA